MALRPPAPSAVRPLLLITALGYFTARETPRVTADSGALAAAVVARDFITFDECGYVAYRVRKPWWKWW